MLQDARLPHSAAGYAGAAAISATLLGQRYGFNSHWPDKLPLTELTNDNELPSSNC
jgi:hypothetical protein